MSAREEVCREFRRRDGAPPALLVRAPGRVNLIGEHTDYNDGFVLPMAIEGAIYLAVRPLDEPRVAVYSLDFHQQAEFSLAAEPPRGEGWPEYLKGVAVMLRRAGYPLRGFTGVLGGDVPVGAGLSSSAALEMAVARTFAAVSGFDWDPPAMARLGQQAENQWVGMNCGIMDQTISAAGRAGCALLIDCRSLELTPVPLPRDTAVVILDTATRRGLVDSAYNERRRQCEAAARHFGAAALRDVLPEVFFARAGELDPTTRRRARHVITENRRTLEAAAAMRRGDAAELGRLMDASHESLRDDFEVTNEALNAIVRFAQEEPYCFGARMTGAGFGGCAVAITPAEEAHQLGRVVAERYAAFTHLEPKVYVTQATDGAGVVVE